MYRDEFYTNKKTGITISYNPNDDELTGNRITAAGRNMLLERYLVDGEKNYLECFLRAATSFADDNEHAQRLFEYFTKCWAMPATPILSNGGTERGLGISCFINDVEDSIEGISDNWSENIKLSVSGGGIGTNWSKIRSVGTSTSTGNKTTGLIPFLHAVDAITLSSWQGSTRRGSTAVHLNVRHPEIEEFINIRKPTMDENRRCSNIHNAVSIPNDFMEAVMNGEPWDLVDPHTQEVTKSVDARSLWMKILLTRHETGEPYVFFIDTANEALPKHLKDKQKYIHSSNLCQEIMLPTAPDRTAVCCLSSLNVEYFDEWKDDPFIIEDMLRMLDNVLTHFIETAPSSTMWRAIASASEERSVGLGTMGFHAFLQKKGVPFEGLMANSWNNNIYKHIQQECLRVNLKLGAERGEPELCEGTGLRFSHTNAIAPNASISIICGETSPSIEPRRANAYVKKTLSGTFLVKNKYLEHTLEKLGKNTEEVWSDIISSEGSVQHLDFLSDDQKDVFKTAEEIDQQWIIQHAATRQPYIDQGQSVNLFVANDVSSKYLYDIHKLAWQSGLKSLYYCHSTSVGKTEKINENCMMCEG